ncbi:LytR/AlgR family response regulator transcription factor [Bordetella genomosp. 13]|uniref:LytR/AlgR family response regulator transcription factor n=1 Tax=Bordetella genomosp. 13 TaxID=463040 RepID=UPI0011A096E4|nr:LytTR family DNA-binding domain-containing protein [Bordetella genomosp. 13]
MLRVIIVDDEAPARRYLRRLLEARSDVRVAGEAATGAQAAALVLAEAPDAMFLDVDLVHGTGFDLLQRLPAPPAVVFVTAHADYAARAFDVAAVDYLLKPVGATRLDDTLARLKRGLHTQAATPPAAPAPYLVVRGRQQTRQIKVESISAAHAQGDYVMLYCADGGTELMNTTLTGLRPQLPEPSFSMVSRSIIVNLDHVARLHTAAGARRVEFTGGAAPLELGMTAFLRLRRELARRQA